MILLNDLISSSGADPGPPLGGIRLKRAGTPDVYYLRHVDQLILVDPLAFPGQLRGIILPLCPGAALGLPPVGCAQNIFTGRYSGGTPD